MNKEAERSKDSYVIVGTAGHVDHGKTTLIKALTGIDTDRLPEEKERGMTTDLGYAAFTLEDGTLVQLLDVPGHEKFIRNMLAGAGGIDAVLLVVDLTEGVRKQTREHLQILDLLGIHRGILVLNKSDCLSEQAAERAADQIQKDLAETFMGQAPTVRVSSLTGSGIEALKKELQNLLPITRDPLAEEALPRMWVSRVFLQKGAGLVAAGTLQSGCLRLGERLACYPGSAAASIREIQVQKESRDLVRAGQRCAINLPGLTRNEVKRGTLLTYENRLEPTRKIEALLTVLPDSVRVIQNQTRLHFFVGTRHILCRVKLPAGRQIGPGEQQRAVILLEEELILWETDRFIVRFYSQEETIGGGMVVDAHPDLRRHFWAGRADSVLPAEQYDRCFGTKVPQNTDQPVLRLQQHSQSYCLPVRTMQLYQERTKERLLAYREEHPYGSGVTKEEWIQALWGNGNKADTLEPLFWDAVLLQMLAEGRIYKEDGLLSDRPYSKIPRNSQFLKIHAKIMQQLTQAGYDFIEVKEWVLREDQKANREDVIRILDKDGQIISLTAEIYTTPELVEEAECLVEAAGLCKEQIRTSELKELLHTSRKQADILRRYWKRQEIKQ